ncbi:MAG: polyprenol phosphomannose-dependent alpha 1,6 mannosyltransferase MptB [Acidimicrobiales bacterium]
MSAGLSVSQLEDHPQGSEQPGKAGAGRFWHFGWLWGLLGFAGSLLMTISGPRLSDVGTANWWFLVRIPPGRAANTAAAYVGIVALSLAWLGTGRRLRREPGTRPVELWVLGALWSLPLVIGPALFSEDMYSYLAQGTILHLGLDPYHVAPVVLGHLGHVHMLDAVSPFWRHTTAPYGPLFLGIVSLIAGITGSHLVAGILLVRLLEIVGVVLLAVFVPRLAKTFGADPCRATWLAVVSPLVLVELVAAGHNDALMAGLMVAGVALARERHPLVGIALCALAATIKVPAGIAVLFILVSWARTLASRPAKARFSAEALLIALGVGAAVSVATGLGIGWVSTTLLSTPGKVHLAITPVTAFAWTLAKLLHAAGATVSTSGLESGFGDATLLATAVLGVVLLWRASSDNFVLYLGIVLLAAALGGPAAWPWYFCWGLVLVAAWPAVQQSRSLPIAVALSVLLVKPDGILVLPLQAAPACVMLYLALAVSVAYRWRRRTDQLAGSGASEG